MSTVSLTNFLRQFSGDESTVNDINILNPLNTFTAEFHFYPTVEGKQLTSTENFVTEVVTNTSVNQTNSSPQLTKTSQNSKTDVDKQEIEVSGSNDYLETRVQTTTTVNEFTTTRSSNLQTTAEYIKQYGGSNTQYNNVVQNSEYNVLDEHNNFMRQNGKYSLSFMHYLTVANQMFSTNDIKSVYPLVVELGKYIQSIVVPMIKVQDGKKSITSIGEFSSLGQFITPDTNTLQITIVNTRLPLLERIFYPWMREVTMPYWSYNSQPYTTATVIVDFSQHTDMRYVFCGCRPTQIQTIQPNQENDQSFTRSVTLLFDYMFITSNLKTKSAGIPGNGRGEHLVETVGMYSY